jgi:septal ring factor EnvC (AmiA/AmiB activator)
MPQMSKILQSRDEWRSKAIQRANEIREHRKNQKRFQKRVAELKAQISAVDSYLCIYVLTLSHAAQCAVAYCALRFNRLNYARIYCELTIHNSSVNRLARLVDT